MTNTILALVFLLLALGGVVARKTYYALPVRELKRRAARHDQQARQLYRAVAYGASLRTLLWLYIGFTGAASFILLARLLPVWASLLIVGPLLWITFSLVPATRVTKLGTRLTVLATPLLAWLLDHLHPLLSRAGEQVEQHYKLPAHTGLFEREDLLDLIERQQHQPDSNFTDEELAIVSRVLSFADQVVGDVMISRKSVKTILAGDTIGPILIDEIHKSGQQYALVRETRKGAVVGSLAFGQLGLGSSGTVRDVMTDTVYYLHEADRLDQALHAFFVTNHALFVVVNSSEECVGILTLANVFEQLLGHVPGDDFDQYADLAAVANRHVKKAEAEPEPAEPSETPVKTDDEVVE